MMRTVNATGLLLAALIAIGSTPAAAVVLDATYRGTLVCDKLPFAKSRERAAISVTILGGAAHYSHAVRLRTAVAEPTAEQGAGTVTGQNIALQGSWSGAAGEYKAAYSGTFVRRTARLKGTQTWTVAGKTVTRACSGAIKRPLRAFIMRRKKAF